jgi:hypothetical protein
VFFAISGFLGIYKCLQIIEANDGKLHFTDVLKLYGRKFLRLAPTTYFFFFMTWAIISRLDDGPLWMNSNTLYYECDKYWWAQVLFIGNLVPYFVEVTLGCFYWGWAIFCDMQCYLYVPFFALVYKKSPAAGIFIPIFLIIYNTVFTWVMSAEWDFKAGPLAIEDYYMFAIVYNKPWFKQGCHCTGILFGILYFEILKYRKLPTIEEKQATYPKIHALHQYKNLSIFLNFLSLAAIFFSLADSFEANKDPYKWPQWLNNMFWACNRILHNFGSMYILLSMFLGHFNCGMRSLRNPYFRGLGRLTFVGAIVSPVILNIMYMGCEKAIYLTNPTVL